MPLTARIDIKGLLLTIAKSTSPEVSDALKESAQVWANAPEEDKRKLEAFLIQFVQIHELPTAKPVDGPSDMFVGDQDE